MAKTILFAGARYQILVSGEMTKGAWSLLSSTQPPGNRTPPHLHRREIEMSYVLSGHLTVETGNHTRHLEGGQFALLPRYDPHRISNHGDCDARYLLFCAPAGFEHFVAEVGEPASRDDEPARPMTDALRRRLAHVALSYGIEVLDEDALCSPPRNIDKECASEPIDVIGIRVDVLAEAGPKDDDAAFLHTIMPPGALIPLHSHPEPECFFVLKGQLDVHLDGVWHHTRASHHVFIPGDAPHAIRNAGQDSATAICTTVASLVQFFRDAGDPIGVNPPGPPSQEQMRRLLRAAATHGHTLYSPAEQAAIGIPVAGGSEAPHH